MKNLFYFILFSLLCSCNSKNDIPFFYNGNLYLSGVINDTIDGSFVFDTGAYGLYLDSTYDHASKLEYLSPETLYYSTPGEMEAKYSLKLAVGNVTYTSISPRVMQMKRCFGKFEDGIIGWDLFKDTAISIDYKNRIIKQVDAKIFFSDPSYTKIPMVLKNTKLYIRLDIDVSDNLKITDNFVFDCGYGGFLLLTDATTKKHKIDSAISKKIKYVGAWNSLYDKASGFDFRARSIKFGGFKIDDPILDCSTNEKGLVNGNPEWAGLLGNAVFEKFEVVLDFKNKMLYLKSSEKYNEKMKFMLGLNFTDRTDVCDDWFVNMINIGSEAYKAGIKVGDRVTQINGKPVKEISREFRHEIRSKKEGDEIIFTIKRGSKVTDIKVKLREYL